MTEMTPTWTQPSTSSSTENIHPADDTLTGNDASKKKKPPQQPRQLLSCTKCRERKVKCDRTKPCSACCARGQPKECHFVVAEGGDYSPIQQSYELRKLRAENLRLKERLRAGVFSLADDQSDRPTSPDRPVSETSWMRAMKRSTSSRQRRFKSQEQSDNLYFGSPGLANVINDFANLQVGPQSLTHAMPRGADIYAPQNSPAFPFATMWPAYPQACIPALLKCLPPRDELLSYLETFQCRAQSCSFPHVPDEITATEIERFLSDAQKNAEMFPDMLALLFAALAQGSQNGVFDKCGGKWVEGAMEAESKKGDVYVAAAMQALRMASFMNRPTLLAIQTLIMIGPYLTNSGRFLDAWALFGITIRLAHSIGLHRNPKYLDPAPPLRECALRQTLWWWMLHMDQQYSMTLGRPLGISGIGDCSPPEPLTTNPTILRLGEFVNQFTVLARQILSSDRLTNGKIDSFTDRLRALWDTMPEMLQFDESWLDESKETPEWPLDAMAAVFYGKTHNYLILLNRQRIDNRSPMSHSPVASTATPPIPAAGPSTVIPPPSGSTTPPPPLPRGRALVISSSNALLSAFLFFYHHVPAALICWTMGQQAFNSCMILLLDALETGNVEHIPRVQRAYAVFVELERKGVHKLAGLAVGRVSWGLALLRRREKEAAEGEASMAGMGVGATGMDGPMDTVMGNTGMLLLEDPGLQSFKPESFAPLGWDMAGRNLHAHAA
ncbi:hypothetical protein AOQ84DRAFT_371003, partial [Glonium stellatum]